MSRSTSIWGPHRGTARPAVFLLCIAVVTAFGLPRAGAADVQEIYGSSISHHCRAGETCITTAATLSHMDCPTIGSDFDKLFKQSYSSDPDPAKNWTVTYGGSLGGSINIGTYEPRLCHSAARDPNFNIVVDPNDKHCIHGVNLTASFDPTVVLPAGQFHWIQRFHFWGGYCGYEWPIDDFIDCTRDPNFARSALGPYYWDPNEDARLADPNTGHSATWFMDTPQSGCRCHGDHCDVVGQPCPKPCSWGADVWTFLAIGDPINQANPTLTIYDGFAWGFSAECIPEPTLISMLALGALTLIRRRQKR